MRYNLKKERIKKGYTQKEIAKQIGISENYYQKLEYAVHTGNLSIWYKLKDILEVTTIDYLLENHNINNRFCQTKEKN